MLCKVARSLSLAPFERLVKSGGLIVAGGFDGLAGCGAAMDGAAGELPFATSDQGFCDPVDEPAAGALPPAFITEAGPDMDLDPSALG